MKKICFIVIVLFAVVLVFSCSSNRNEVANARRMAEEGHWNVSPSEVTLSVIGVTGIHSRQNDAIAAARENAARKVAMFHGVQGSFISDLHDGTDFWDFVFEANLDIEYDDWEMYAELLEYGPDDVFLIDHGVAVWFRFPVSVTPVNLSIELDEQGRPGWIHGLGLPYVPGYTIATGFSPRLTLKGDTAMRSVEAAITNIMLSGGRHTVENIVCTETGTIRTLTRCEGNLRYFRVLEIWIDPVGGSIHTLAMARVE